MGEFGEPVSVVAGGVGNKKQSQWRVIPFSQRFRATSHPSLAEQRDNEWYCQVCRGKQKTLPMGPYTKLQAERVQDLRRRVIAREGTARLVFEPDRRWLAMTPRGNGQSTARKNKPPIRRALAAIRSLVMPLLSR